MGKRSSFALGAVLLGAGLLSVGCGQASVSKDEVATEIATKLEKQVGQRPDEVTCPDDLPAEVGKTMRCELTAGGDKLGVTVKVTGTEGGRAQFDVEVEEA